MITISEAFAVLESLNYAKRVIELPLLEARTHVLAETLFSPISMPPFRQATMDGFALSLHGDLQYEIVGEVKAGDIFTQELQSGQAAKIFTGAAVPDSAQAVIQVEKGIVENCILHLQEVVKPETNVRQKGAQIMENDVALEKGTFLNAAAIGFLAGLGFDTVKVYQKPSIAIVVTGNELVEIDRPLSEGKVYDSNTIMLQTALLNSNFEDIKTYQVKDDFECTLLTLEQAIRENEVVLVSGGISVGDYDFVSTVLESLSVEALFYKVNQKPGKPLYAGRKGEKIIFALPGNPAASLTCFYVYALPTLQKIAGNNANYGTQERKKITHDFSVDSPRPQFLKARVSGNGVAVLSHQDSAMLTTFASANSLVFLPEGKYEVCQNDKVLVYSI